MKTHFTSVKKASENMMSGGKMRTMNPMSMMCMSMCAFFCMPLILIL